MQRQLTIARSWLLQKVGVLGCHELRDLLVLIADKGIVKWSVLIIVFHLDRVCLALFHQKLDNDKGAITKGPVKWCGAIYRQNCQSCLCLIAYHVGATRSVEESGDDDTMEYLRFIRISCNRKTRTTLRRLRQTTQVTTDAFANRLFQLSSSTPSAMQRLRASTRLQFDSLG